MYITKQIPIIYFVNITLIFCVFTMSLKFSKFNTLKTDSLIVPIIIVIILSIYFLLLYFKINVNKRTALILLPISLFFFYYIFNVNYNFEYNINYSVEILIIGMVFLYTILLGNKIFIFRFWIIFLFIFSNFTFLSAIITVFHFNNSMGIMFYLLLFFNFAYFNEEKNIILKYINIYTVALNILIIFLSNSRTSILVLMITLFIFVFWKYFRRIYSRLIVLVIAISISFIFIYLYLYKAPLGMRIDEISITYTEKSFFSGRQIAWDLAINDVIETGKIMMGMGINAEFYLLFGYLHNLYVQLFYQSGIVGLSLIVIIFLSISYLFKRKIDKNDNMTKTLAAFFIGIIILQNFEGLMIYNFSIISLLTWIIVGLFLNNLLFGEAKKENLI